MSQMRKGRGGHEEIDGVRGEMDEQDSDGWNERWCIRVRSRETEELFGRNCSWKSNLSMVD